MASTAGRWRAGATLVALLVGAALVGATPTPATARPTAPVAACGADSDGVTVVVDFGTLPGGVQIRCVTEPVSSGFDALTTAGFSYTGTQRFPGLLCRIDGKPADAPCVHAPPPDRYWAYWIADAPGGAWTYSDLGAGNRTPPPGSVEGWAFSDGCTRAPQGPPCPIPTTATTTGPPTATTGGPSGGTGGGRDAGSSTSVTSAAGTPGGRETTTTTERSSTTTTSEVPSGGVAPQPGEEGSDADGTDASAAASVATDGGGGSPLGAVVGLGMAAGLVALAVVTLRRRRSSEGEPA
jgi:hypothetical protein